MPVAIAILPGGVIPAVIFEADDTLLIQRLAGLVGAPVLADRDAAAAWLATLPDPSGWYASPADAQLRLAQIARADDMTGPEVQSAREALGLSRADLALSLGLKGNSNTNHKYLWEVETGKARLSPVSVRRLRALLAQAGLAQAH